MRGLLETWITPVKISMFRGFFCFESKATFVVSEEALGMFYGV